MSTVGHNHINTVYIRQFWQGKIKYTDITGVYVRFWPTLSMSDRRCKAMYLQTCTYLEYDGDVVGPALNAHPCTVGCVHCTLVDERDLDLQQVKWGSLRLDSGMMNFNGYSGELKYEGKHFLRRGGGVSDLITV